jgi:hypothetical protein
MRHLCSCLLLSLLIASSASAVTMDWTPIGNPDSAMSYGQASRDERARATLLKAQY